MGFDALRKVSCSQQAERQPESKVINFEIVLQQKYFFEFDAIFQIIFVFFFFQNSIFRHNFYILNYNQNLSSKVVQKTFEKVEN